ncbi:glycosyltransferase family 4 protein [Methylocystis sp. S23]
MTRILFAIPGDLSARTGGYEYDRRILGAARAFGAEMIHLPLAGRFPNPSPEDAAAAVEALNHAYRPADVVLMDGLACGALPEAAIREIRAPVIELCHHPLCLEAGLSWARASALEENERRVLAAAAHVIVTSRHVRGTLESRFGVPPDKMSIAPPGTDPAPRARGTAHPLSLLAVGSIIPRKGFDILVEALAGLADLDWRLTIAGSRDHAPGTARALQALISAHGLTARVDLAGELSSGALQALFDGADIFVSSSLYEGYGMALAEALAHGLPVVTTTGGAAAETIPDGAALKVPPGECGALRSALRFAMTNEALRRRLAEAAWRAGRRLPRWENAARIIVEAARRVGARAI